MKKGQKAENSSAPAQSEEKDFPVVGIGASAGGIKALKQFFAEMPPDSGMAFVVILHLSQTHESHLAEIIQTQTAMPVEQITKTVKVEPNKVYVIPPAKYLEMTDGVIALRKPERIRGKRVPIDLLFRTLGDAYGKNGIAVVLSGTGSDGTLGLKRVKESGGIAFAQEPAEAEYDGMPRSAIGTGLVDLILPVAQMPEKIIAIRQFAKKLGLDREDEAEKVLLPKTDEGILREILSVLRVRTGHDFANYKRPTLFRRIARRLQVRELENMSDYLVFLREHPTEVQSLFNDLLITVTNFFRDKEAFAALETKVVPQLFAHKSAGDTVRVWTAACATGEEAFSIAILLCEHASTLNDPPKIQIFASDINESAIRTAREHFYDEAIVADVSPERLKRFFIREGNGYRVKKELRELVLFAPHNILRDPPFSRLDLITCRNLLIYLARETQERVMEIFNFALRGDGFLFLGSSESAETTPSLFTAVNKKQRIYRCRPTLAHHKLPAISVPDHWQIKLPETPERSEKNAPTGSFADLHLRLVEQFAPPSVLVNEDYEIVHSSPTAGKFLQFIGGEPSRNLLKVAHPAIQLDLRAALMTAKQENRQSESSNIRVRLNGRESFVNLIVRPSEDDLFLIIFEESAETSALETKSIAEIVAGDEAIKSVVLRLEEELQTARNRLRNTIEQSETSTEELKASNEELQAINEELRSASEELETSQEELQSLNEELVTVNHELKDKVDEISRANSDLQNLMGSTDIGTIFLDRDLNIKFYTPPVKELFNIIPSDIGRPFEHLTHKFKDGNLVTDAETVLKNLKTVEREILTADNRRFVARLLPYRTMEDRIDGVVLNFVNFTERWLAEKNLAQSEERYRNLFDLIDEGFCVIEILFDENGVPNDFRYLEINPTFEKQTGLVEAQGKTIRELAPDIEKSWFEIYGRVAQTGEPVRFENYAAPLERWFECYGFPTDAPELNRVAVLFKEITDRKRSEANLAFLADFSQDLVNLSDVSEIVQTFGEKICKFINCSVCAFVEINETKDVAVINYEWQKSDEFSLAGHYKLPEFVTDKFREMMAAGQTIVVRDVRKDSQIEDRKKFAALKIVSFLNTPLTSEGEWKFALGIYHEQPYDWRDDEIALMTEAASRIRSKMERIRTAEDLRQSEEKFRDLANSISQLAWMTDAEGYIFWYNKRWFDYTGTTLEKMQGWGWQSVHHPEYVERVTEKFKRHIASGEIWEDTFPLLSKDGEYRWFLSRALPIRDESGRIIRWFGTNTDIEDVRRAEESLKNADRRKDEFLATLAHELRNPLAPVRSGLEIVRRSIDSQSEAGQILGTVERQTDQIQRLVDDLLDVSRITEGKIKLRREVVSLRRIIELALETSRVFIEEYNHQITLTIPDEPIYVEADLTRMEQVFMNLLNNAAKYTKPGGLINIKAEAEKTAIITVEDNGIGIAPERLTEIFDIFSQLPNGEQPQSGLGIGLNLVKKLVELHDGTITAESEGEGKGSRFILRLPVSDAPKTEEKSQTDKKITVETKTLRILAVDDNADAVRMLEVLLKFDGHEIRTALEGKSALKIAEEFAPDVVLLDIGLPGMNGYEIARLLRQKMPSVLLIAISGWGQDEDRDRSKKAGFDHHLVKPIKFEELQELLK